MKDDYDKINFLCGIEIHQELSGKKLFCSCSADLKEEKKDLEIKREIRSSVGESGEADVASLYEQKKNLKFVYYGYEDEHCLIECDEQPPDPINQDALKTALEIATILKLKIPDELIVMRKVISDGSVVSGFQRSLLVGLGNEESFIDTSQGRVRIKDIYLEEDAAKIIKKERDNVYFSLSRAGIPLIEIGTQPDIKTPEQAKEVASYLGMLLRSVPGIRRGIGTIRQDVNMSILNGARIELKGFQDLRNMPYVIENEIKRQLEMMNQGNKIKEEVRKVNADCSTSFLRPMPGASRLYPETDIPNIKIDKELLNGIKKTELIDEKIVRIGKQYNLNNEIARVLVKENKLELFEELHKQFGMPELIARTILLTVKDLKNRLGLPSDKLTKKDFEEIFNYVKKGMLDKGLVSKALEDRLQGKFSLAKYKVVDEKELEFFIKNLVKEKGNLSDGALMGIIMQEYKGMVDGKIVMEILKKIRGT